MNHPHLLARTSCLISAILFAGLLTPSLGCDDQESLRRALPAPPEQTHIDDRPSDILLLKAEPRVIDDDDIAHSIRERLIIALGPRAKTIDVSSQDNIVTLSGNVTTLLARERAQAISAATTGVFDVVDELEVEPGAVADETLQHDIEAALVSQPATHSWDVSTAVQDGIVTLTGEVASWHERLSAERTAAQVHGVREIHNAIEVSAPALRTDNDVRADVQEALAQDVYLDSGLLTVEVRTGIVELSGLVGSVAERERAKQLAWTAGVKKVNSADVSVRWWLRDEMVRSAPQVGNGELAAKLTAALKREPLTSTSRISVVVRDNLAQLNGEVPNLAAKLRAEQTVRNFRQVHEVVNNLAVAREMRISDPLLAERVRSALARDPYVHGLNVDVQVLGGRAILRGMVDSNIERISAEQATGRIAGITEIDNQLRAEEVRVKHDSDSRLATSIQNTLILTPYIDAAGITIAVVNGVTTLNGDVRTYMARDEATRLAKAAGATRVDNRLQVVAP